MGSAWRPVDGADLAEGMTFKGDGSRMYTIKGIGEPLERGSGQRRNAWVRDSEGTPGALAVYRGTAYPVVDAERPTPAVLHDADLAAGQ
jgi:hypothetical protein